MKSIQQAHWKCHISDLANDDWYWWIDTKDNIGEDRLRKERVSKGNYISRDNAIRSLKRYLKLNKMKNFEIEE